MKPVTKLQKALNQGHTVLIEFVKKDGTERRACVTTNLEDIPADKHPKGSGKAKGNALRFFDLKKGDWISCCGESLQMVKPQRPETPAQRRRRQQAKERWTLVQRILAVYSFTVGEALKLLSGKCVGRYHYYNLDL